jgi:tellurite resistance protein TehA-like permease
MLAASSFAFVMATGIVSVAAHQQGVDGLDLALLALGAAAYAGLAIGQLARLATRPGAVRDELGSPGSAFGFLTAVAGLEVLANALTQDGAPKAGAVLAGVGAALALGLGAAVARTVLRASPAERTSDVSGSWLLSTVALESIAVAAADLAHPLGAGWLRDVATVLWLAGLAVYVPTLALLGRRLARQGLDPGMLAGDHWIVMGALAIAALAAASLRSPLGVRHGDFELALWLACCPPLAGLIGVELWALRHVPGALGYRAQRWATVFPLGMLSAAGHTTGVVAGWPALRHVATALFGIALAAWAAALFGLVLRLPPSGR